MIALPWFAALNILAAAVLAGIMQAHAPIGISFAFVLAGVLQANQSSTGAEWLVYGRFRP